MASRAQDLIDRATAAIQAGRVPEAVRPLEQATRLDPGSATAHFLLGICRLRSGQAAPAAESLRRAIGLNPGIANYWRHLGMAEEQRENFAPAAEAYRRAGELEPGNARDLVRLALIANRLGQGKEEIEYLRRALAIEENAGGYLQLAVALMRAEREPEALEAAQASLRLDPSSASGHELVGALHESGGRFAEAGAAFARALELQPTRGSAHYRTLRTRRMTEGDRPMLEGLEMLAARSDLSPEDLRYLHYALGKGRDDLGEYGLAMDHWDIANRLARRLQLHDRPYPADAIRAAFDRMATIFTRDRLAEPAGFRSDDPRPVFIVGMIRSGTTLVEQILGCHPDVGAGGELKFWVEPEARRLFEEVCQGRIDTSALTRFAAAYQALLDKIAPGGLRVTDKMPNNYMALGLIHLLFPEARIVHCRRHPVDTAISIYSTVFQDPPAYAYDRPSIVSAIKEYRRLMAHWRASVPPDRLIEIDYEELVRDLGGVARRLVDFLGLKWNDACLRPEANPRIVTTPSLWQVRQPIYGTSVERWRRYEPWLGPFRDLLE